MADITQIVGQITNLPVVGVDVGEDFATKGTEAFNQLNIRATELNTQSSQANALKNEVNDSRDTALEAVVEATEQVVLATSQAVIATQQASAAIGASNNKGSWSLLSGSLSIPASVNYNSAVWILNVSIADVTTSEPSEGNSDWTKLETGFNYTEKTSTYTAVAKDYIYANTVSGAFTITLPLTPAQGDTVVISNKDITNTLTVDGNGKNINIRGEADTALEINTVVALEFNYNGTYWEVN